MQRTPRPIADWFIPSQGFASFTSYANISFTLPSGNSFMGFLDSLSKFLPSRKSEAPSEFYFGLNIKPGLVTGSIWGIIGNKVKIISFVDKKFKSETDLSESTAELVEAANIALDQALADFQPEPEKILFGVPDSWLQDEELKGKYSQVLKKLTKELDVVPLAYVSTTHAVTHFLQRQEGAPVTTILAEVGDPLIVSVVKASKVLSTKEIARGESLARDIEKALLSFGDIEVLPAKIILFGKGDLPRLKEDMVSFNWMSQLPFLHIPKIDSLEENMGIKALSFAGASEINPHVHLDHQTVTVEDKKSPLRHPVHEREIMPAKAGGTAPFVAGDVSEKSIPQDDGSVEYAVQNYEKSVSSPAPFKPSNLEKLSPGALMPKGLPNFSHLLGGLGMTLIIPVVILIAVVAGYLLLPKANVIVFVDPKILERETQVVADPAVTTMNESSKQIPGEIVDTTVDGTAKAPATGKKQIGDPAKGTVVLYNKTSSSKNFPAGTELVGSGNITFKLDNNVTVASQSAVEGGISFGKGTANATATAIGPDGNLAAGKDLTIKGLNGDQYTAKVDSAFSGGVSKDVTVVTSDDQKRLLASLTSDLKKKASDEVQGKLTGDMKILEETFSEKVIKQSFSKNVGDQATELSLTLNLNLKGTAYKDADLKTIVGKLVETNVPEGYDLDISRAETQASVSKVEKDGKIIFTAKFKAKLMPKLDAEQIKKQITFKTPTQVEDILKTHESVIGADIKTTPELPGPLLRLPLLPGNINLEISSN